MTSSTAPTITIKNRETLIFYLTEASELEHMLCCSYLFAAFSLRSGADDGLTASQLAAVREWKQVLQGIAVQEMGHLAQVSNLLTAVGGAAHFGRPNFPQHGRYYPSHLQLTLAPFSEETLEHFVFLEQPEDATHTDPHDVAEPAREDQTAVDHEVVPEPRTYATVGELYDALEQGLRGLVAQHGAERVFIGPPAAQADASTLGIPGLVAVTDLDSAVAAIATIVEEGEGVRGDREQAHYGRFRRIQREFRELKQQQPDFAPARPVLTNPCTVLPSDASDDPEAATRPTLIDEPGTVAAMDLFNASYGLMVQLWARCFTRTEETDAEFEVLVDGAMRAMSEVLGPLGDLLTQLPAGPSAPGRTAGPGFEFQRAIQALPYRRAAWIRFHERWQELAEYAGELAAAGEAAPLFREVQGALQRLADTFNAANHIGRQTVRAGAEELPRE